MRIGVLHVRLYDLCSFPPVVRQQACSSYRSDKTGEPRVGPDLRQMPLQNKISINPYATTRGTPTAFSPSCSPLLCLSFWVGRCRSDIAFLTCAKMQVDEAMIDAAPEEDAPATPPLVLAPQAPAEGKRPFRHMASPSNAKLAKISASGEGGVGEQLYAVAQRVQTHGYIYLTEAALLLGKKHTTRALEKITHGLPLLWCRFRARRAGSSSPRTRTSSGAPSCRRQSAFEAMQKG